MKAVSRHKSRPADFVMLGCKKQDPWGGEESTSVPRFYWTKSDVTTSGGPAL